jgi:predicted RNA-binding protein associated with RNAse of E/G family
MPDDSHLFPIDIALKGYDKYVQENRAIKGTITYVQMYLYVMPNCGLTQWITLPNSGYRITHTLETGNNGAIMATTSKRAKFVQIYYDGKNYSTNPGLTEGIKPVKRQLRP